MENGYYRPGDPLPKSAKRENAITELLNRVGMTGVAPSKGGSLPAGCVHCAWLSVVEARYEVPANSPVCIVGFIPDSDIVFVTQPLENGDQPYDGLIVESFKVGSIGILRLNGWMEVAINNPEQFDGFSRYVWVEPYTGVFKWMCGEPQGISKNCMLESKLLSPQKALVRVESIGKISPKSILVAKHQLFYVDQVGGGVFLSADRLPTEDSLELLFLQDGSWLGVLEGGPPLPDYNFLKVQKFTRLKANDILLIESQKSLIEIVDFPKETLPFIHGGSDNSNDLITIRIRVYHPALRNTIKVDEKNNVNIFTRYSYYNERSIFDFKVSEFPEGMFLYAADSNPSFNLPSDTTSYIVGVFDGNSPTGFTYASGGSILTGSLTAI